MDSASPLPADVASLFSNSDPAEVWNKALAIARRIDPDYDPAFAQVAFDDVVRLFRGEYPGYCPVMTPYHDLPHTLDVFLCAMRLLHGVHVLDGMISSDEIDKVMIAALMHDIGYAQTPQEASGSGAQFTQRHVQRGIEFMRSYLAAKNAPPGMADSLAPIILGTDPAQKHHDIAFPDERTRMLGKIVCTADLTGQMADRTYLEKLLYLYLEFKEANYGNFQSVHDMLSQTGSFYAKTRKRLDEELDGMYAQLALHFRDTMGVENNYYLESIEKNVRYLSQVIELDEADRLARLKRGGIVEKARNTPESCR